MELSWSQRQGHVNDHGERSANEHETMQRYGKCAPWRRMKQYPSAQTIRYGALSYDHECGHGHARADQNANGRDHYCVSEEVNVNEHRESHLCLHGSGHERTTCCALERTSWICLALMLEVHVSASAHEAQIPIRQQERLHYGYVDRSCVG
jgi:hypothetical protein